MFYLRHARYDEKEPKTPSTRLSSLGEEAIKASQIRCTEVATLARGPHKELKWVPLKTMRKERTDHYRSLAEGGRGSLYYIVKQ